MIRSSRNKTRAFGFWLMVFLATLLVSDRVSLGALEGKSRALIVVGLPGDSEHETRWGEVVGRWRAWLSVSLGFDPGEVRVLGAGSRPATREAIASEAAEIRKTLKPGDRLWVFWLGHANQEGSHAYFHLPGPDLSDDDMADLFRGLTCREQVFWMTSAGSGWLMKPLSAPGRVVVTATERDQEFNETEFPEALAELAVLPAEKLDANHDGRVSVFELFTAAADATLARFAADKRLPTEHAKIDDNGDGEGTERPDLAPAEGQKKGDGLLAARTFLPAQSVPKKP